MTSEPEVLVEVSDGVGRLTLNRPRAINALTEAMCATMLDGLRAWSAPASGVRAVELHGAGERGLCAGADIKAIRALDAAAAQAFFRTEYTLNHAIATHRLPYTASMNGIVMGGGLGVSAHGSRRIVRPDTRVAMPETIIGFVPDVGILWHLSRAGLAGVHAALTGSTSGPATRCCWGSPTSVTARRLLRHWTPPTGCTAMPSRTPRPSWRRSRRTPTRRPGQRRPTCGCAARWRSA